MVRRLLVYCGFLCVCLPGSLALMAQSGSAAETVPGRLVVVYRKAAVPADADSLLAGTRVRAHLGRLGVSVVSVAAGEEEAARRWLETRPEVAAVLRDQRVDGHMPVMMSAAPPVDRPVLRVPSAIQRVGSTPGFVLGGIVKTGPAADQGYVSPGGWAVRGAGGYGDYVAGGGAAGPWNQSMGAGVRIAVLDTGVDEHHPDLAPNLAVNMSEVDQTALPSACDDGSPQDQQGHGTWAASLAVAAIGAGTGDEIGVAPQATLLNIKVLQRMPAASGATLTAQCEAGQSGGLLSWVLAGINDAMVQKANVISMSLGTLVDLTMGDGAGWKASFDRVTYAASQAGIVLVASAGNDGVDLSGGRYVELPAQARGVLAVTASTNPACAENLAAGAVCAAGPVTRAYYSNYGGAVLDAVAAPGGSYPEGADLGVSGWIRGACSSGLVNTADGLPSTGESFGCFGLGHVPYVQAMGTSASAPLVAGAAAILRAARPGWTAAQIVSALRSSATSLPTMAEPEINLAAALALP